jgi:hypothetical protein
MTPSPWERVVIPACLRIGCASPPASLPAPANGDLGRGDGGESPARNKLKGSLPLIVLPLPDRVERSVAKVAVPHIVRGSVVYSLGGIVLWGLGTGSSASPDSDLTRLRHACIATHHAPASRLQ